MFPSDFIEPWIVDAEDPAVIPSSGAQAGAGRYLLSGGLLLAAWWSVLAAVEILLVGYLFNRIV